MLAWFRETIVHKPRYLTWPQWVHWQLFGEWRGVFWVWGLALAIGLLWSGLVAAAVLKFLFFM
jgi:hypothetical protein